MQIFEDFPQNQGRVHTNDQTYSLGPIGTGRISDRLSDFTDYHLGNVPIESTGSGFIFGTRYGGSWTRIKRPGPRGDATGCQGRCEAERGSGVFGFANADERCRD